MVLFVCEYNQYAFGIAFEYSSGNPSVAPRDAAYGIARTEVDGNNVLSV